MNPLSSLAARVCRAAAISTFLLSSIAGADEPLSLAQAVALAEAQAPALRAREAGVAEATAALTPAGELPDPELVFGVDNLPVDGADAFAVSRDSMTMRTIGVMQTFTRRDTRRANVERAAGELDRERALLAAERLAVRESVAHAWIAASALQARVDALQTLRPRAQLNADAATAALVAGRGGAADGIAARTALAALDDRIAATAAERDAARIELARWLPDLADRALGEAPDWFDLGADPDALPARLDHHRELVAYDAAERAAQADAALARARKRPDWSLELMYAQRGGAYANMVSLQVRVPLPLFAHRRQDPLIAAKEAAIERLDAERDDARQRHGAELRKTLLAWRSAADRARRYERDLLPLADARADAALAAYRGGRGDLAATLLAFDDAVEKRLAFSDVERSLADAWATLAYAFAQEGQP
ncbi:TolC family protein [Tahibacter soli]|uniref:TolC family protein n=1 Tax=Tahibacter soli TaxID=2983605 RepID=A0A9X3YLK5_9GAMM|nr:TolC family protein [Tahibacter soli]MDC8014661.1 TolC family protein [Tahibacter soli]